MTGGEQFPDLAQLAREVDLPPLRRPWWIKHDQLLAALAILFVWGFTFYAIGRL